MNGRTVTFDGAEVDDVLVEPGLSKDAAEVRLPAGARVDYTLRMRCDAEPPSHGAKAVVDGIELDVLNVPAHWRPGEVFGTWSNPYDMTVLVGRTLGDFASEVSIVAAVVAVDALGDPVRTEVAVYDGPAQARMESGTEPAGEDAEKEPRETWWFVVPWLDALAAYRPDALFVDCGGARYDVVSVENIENASENASIKAVRHG